MKSKNSQKTLVRKKKKKEPELLGSINRKIDSNKYHGEKKKEKEKRKNKKMNETEKRE